jgi:hypothetical protein
MRTADGEFLLGPEREYVDFDFIKEDYGDQGNTVRSSLYFSYRSLFILGKIPGMVLLYTQNRS